MTRYGMRLGALLMIAVGALVGLGAREDAPSLPDDLARVPPKAQAVLTVRVAELWNGDLGKDFRAALGKEQDRMVDELKRFYGVGPADIERLTVLTTDLGDHEHVALIFRVTGKLDRKKVLSAVVPGGREEVIGGEVVLADDSKAASVSEDRRTLVIGRPRGVRLVLTAKPGKPSPALAEMFEKAAKHSVSAYVDPSSLADMLDMLPAPLTPVKPLLLANNGVAWADVGYTSKLGMKLSFKDDKAAGRGRKVIDAVRALASLTLAGTSESFAAESKPLAALMSKVEKALDDATVEQKGTTVEAAFSAKAERTEAAAAIKEGVAKLIVAAALSRGANNLKQIAIALHSYHDSVGSFPPQAVYDKDGKALLSWRVLILPYIEQDALYKEFRLDEPWDSEHNKKLIARIPPTYVSPQGKASAVGGTFYQGFHGKMAFFEGKRGIKFADITDGTSNTIMVTESAVDVPWTKPADLPFDPDGKLPKLGGLYAGGFHAMLCDGSVRFLKATIKPDTLKMMITRNGGEVIPGDD
jgi:hypothetical protein